MTEKEFLDEIHFYKVTEIDKIKYLAYYYYITKSVKEFSYEDIKNWFDNLSLPRPNKWRLIERIKKFAGNN